MTYTVVTFAPVQSFIRTSRKLRDLYGSSLLLSHLARAIAEDAQARGHAVISPASISSSRGVPNVLVIRGDYRKGHAREALLKAWKGVLDECRWWLENALNDSELATPDWEQSWGVSWKTCGRQTWELFHGLGPTIAMARESLAVNKLQRDWCAPNWTGESSSLSSAEAVARPSMGAVIDPRQVDPEAAQAEARRFLAVLRSRLGEAFAGAKEEISLTELVKRLVTYPEIARRAFATQACPNPDLRQLLPERFQRLSGSEELRPESLIWFMADGDAVGCYLKSLQQKKGEAEALQSFSAAMRDWSAGLYARVPALTDNKGLVVYAGGDDVFGVLHESQPGRCDLTPADLWAWLDAFPALWRECGQAQLTVSMGLVWASGSVPQREALQHARETEASAKQRGRNRFALRLLYAGGNHLEWTCPWAWLAPLRSHYRDREGRGGSRANWRHLADDLIWLRSRQAISTSSPGQDPQAQQRIAHTLWQAYFPGCELPPEPPTQPREGGNNDPSPYCASIQQPEQGRRFDQWLLDLGRVMAAVETWSVREADRSMAA
ncbi:MAG: type III-B CRISPR-associated protein Cas10/Cmr2 [Chitinophagaceae bacterium]|nr:type III-B CRISPR-associated protein Cas10/Cmr2 [Chitinophagaceae bacterium]